MTERRFDSATYREGFVRGWVECVGDKELDKHKLRQIAEAAANSVLGTPTSPWITVAKQRPYDGQLVVLRMADERQNIHYCIGWYDGPTMNNTGWVITSSPQTEAGLDVVAWFEMPK